MTNSKRNESLRLRHIVKRGEGEAFQEKEALLVDIRSSMFDELASRRGRRKTAKLVCGAKADRTRRRFGLHVVVTVIIEWLLLLSILDDFGMVRWPRARARCQPEASYELPAAATTLPRCAYDGVPDL